MGSCILSIIVDAEWSIPSTFSQQTIEQIELIQEKVLKLLSHKILSEIDKLNDFTRYVMNKK